MKLNKIKTMKNIRKIKKTVSGILVGIACFISTYSVFASNTINSLSIVEGTIKGVSKCMHYKVIGMCYWLKCSSIYCHVDTTLKLDQYLPDAVVSVYTQHNNNPWWFAQHLEDPVFYQVGKAEMKYFSDFGLGSGGDENDNTHRDINNKFHEVDIMGNPALSILDWHGLMLRSAATPFVPYYSSLMDAYAWRFPGLERFYPGSIIPGLHDVGMIVLHDWGPVYPRNGYVNQPDDAKAAAVDALRASTIVTRPFQPHLYMPLSNSCGKHCQIDAVKENSSSAEYQMIYPKVERQCTVFGGSDIMSAHPWETDASTKGHDRYVWILWRHYHGCVQESGAKYLGST